MARRVGMATHPFTDQSRRLYPGYSWTTLCFGFFPAIVRGDGGGAVIGLAVCVVGIYLGSALVPAAMLVPWAVWAGLYNDSHARRLYRNGYVLATRRMDFQEQ